MSNLIPLKHQEDLASRAFEILDKFNLVYISAEERTGKSLTSLLIVDKWGMNQNIIIITKKKAIKGWEDTLNRYSSTNHFDIINYESAHKVTKKYNLAVIDEAHYALGGYPRIGVYAKRVQKITYNIPCIFLSATPSAQTYSQLFHQLNITKYSPWDSYTTFYKWFRDYGIPKTQYISGRIIQKYDDIKIEKIEPILNTYFVSLTRKEIGFEFEPEDKLHYIELSEKTKNYIRELERAKCIGELGYNADSPLKEMLALHQIEGSTLKKEDGVIYLSGLEKIKYIKNKWGDNENIGIFHNYIGEGDLLREYFKNAQIFQGTAFAEGIDLSHLDELIVYSMDFSTARYNQRRARQCNINRLKPIIVHFLLVKNALSEQIYDCVVRNKKNFILKYYKRIDE